LDRRSGALGLHDPRGATACLNSAMHRRGREDDEKKDNGSRQSRFWCETTRRWRNKIGPQNKLHVYYLPRSTGFPQSRHSPQESSSRCETAVRVGSTGRICASDTTPDGERGARSRARASFVVPRQSRRRIRRTGATTKPKKGVCEHRIFDGDERSRDAPDFDAIRSPRGRRGYGFA
jgi:hypothetical protein